MMDGVKITRRGVVAAYISGVNTCLCETQLWFISLRGNHNILGLIKILIGHVHLQRRSLRSLLTDAFRHSGNDYRPNEFGLQTHHLRNSRSRSETSSGRCAMSAVKCACTTGKSCNEDDRNRSSGDGWNGRHVGGEN